MSRRIHYEVFESYQQEGTRTIGNFNTLKEAREFKNKLEKTGHKIPLYIDKWYNESPYNID